MRAKSVKNITNRKVKVQFANGVSADLIPGSTIENVNVTNEEELKGKVLITRDLTEVTEESGKVRLDS